MDKSKAIRPTLVSNKLKLLSAVVLMTQCKHSANQDFENTRIKRWCLYKYIVFDQNPAPGSRPVSKILQHFVCFNKRFLLFPPMLFSSAYETKTTADLRPYSSHWQWSIITLNKTRAGHKNKHNISTVCEDCMVLCKNCAIISPAVFKNKRINMSIFPTLGPFHAVLLLFISRSATAYL